LDWSWGRGAGKVVAGGAAAEADAAAGARVPRTLGSHRLAGFGALGAVPAARPVGDNNLLRPDVRHGAGDAAGAIAVPGAVAIWAPVARALWRGAPEACGNVTGPCAGPRPHAAEIQRPCLEAGGRTLVYVAAAQRRKDV
jgi:hypothetical protein